VPLATKSGQNPEKRFTLINPPSTENGFGEVTLHEVRRLKPEDVQLAEKAVNILKPARERDYKEVTADRMRDFLAEQRNILIVALKERSPVGFVLAYLLDRLDRNQTMILFYEIVVADRHRRHGWGKKMINELKKIGCDLNVMEIWVLTDQSNSAAIALFQSTGAKRAGGDDVMFIYRADGLS
jgi:ribosomal protein S18 acetylase RimI-like enzyme